MCDGSEHKDLWFNLQKLIIIFASFFYIQIQCQNDVVAAIKISIEQSCLLSFNFGRKGCVGYLFFILFSKTLNTILKKKKNVIKTRKLD